MIPIVPTTHFACTCLVFSWVGCVGLLGLVMLAVWCGCMVVVAVRSDAGWCSFLVLVVGAAGAVLGAARG